MRGHVKPLVTKLGTEKSSCKLRKPWGCSLISTQIAQVLTSPLITKRKCESEREVEGRQAGR